jgi:putative oxidoreductase
VIIGLGTRFAAVPIIGFLLIAAFVQHASDPWPKREFALIFMVPFVAVLIAGGGRYALDAAITRVIGRWPKT